ncbi:mechanosensitive ion channel domain-containing protein [Halodesulfovibrio aestuarii]|uniref:Mechanosensitive ion channel n=1 Tax=Halodesulfovibrio aestuarii TaxID=126333 RepID=A0A8G2FI74_9BACT|nr:mechanosensitive ion channel domain-containing protein [Halodesulfovibrio aestuarii]SHJ27151.1 Mechanosensitive ion channel [Halodesulfovibrio aestuarii]
MKFFIFALYCLSILTFPISVSAQGVEEQTHIIDSERFKVLAVLEDEENALREAAAAQLDKIRADLFTYHSSYQQIVLSQGIAGATPMGLRELYARLASLNKKLVGIAESLKDLQNQIEARVESLNSATGELNTKALKELSSDNVGDFKSYIGRLGKLERVLKKQLSRIKRELASVNKLVKRTSTLLARMEQELPLKWKNYFLAGKNPPFSQYFWQKHFSSTNWFSLRLPIWQGRLASAFDEWPSKALFFTMLFALFGGLGLFAGKRIFPKSKHKVEMRKLCGAWAVLSAGISIIFTEYHFFPQTTGVTSIIGASVFSFGAMWGGNIIRRTFSDYAKPSRTPLTWLFAGGGLILVLGMPEQLAIPLWLLLAASVICVMKMRLVSYSGGLSRHPWFWVLVLSVLMAVMGYGRLAAFTGMILFLVYFMFTMGMAGMHVVAHCVSRLPETGLYPFVRALALGISSPLIWTASLGLGGLWIYQFFGAGVLKATAAMKLGWQGFSLQLLNIVIVVALFFLTRAAIAVTDTYIGRMGMGWPRGKRGTMHSLKTISSYILWGLFGLLALNVLGVNLTSLTVIAGGLSVGIGFGMQTIFTNFMSGLILLFGRSIQQGDIIQVGELWCTVKKINIRTTVVETFENATLIIPNSDLISNQVTNWTKDNPTLRRDVLIGVAYGSDTELVEKTLLELADAHPHVLKSPAPWVLFNDFGASSLDFILRIWIDDIDYSLKTISELRFQIDKAFRERNIEIAFPQMDLHIRSAEGLQK